MSGLDESDLFMTDTRDSLSATPLRARRNTRWIAAGVLAICLGGLGAAVLFTNVANAQSVIAITHTVYRDQVIGPDDLRVVSVVPAPGVDTVPVAELEEIVGRTALTDLTEGSLLNPRAFGDPVVALGTARVGLKLAPGRLPSTALPPGTTVMLVPAGRDGAEPPEGPSVAATVAGAASVLADGSSVIDVTVPQNEAERVARLAAADQLVLIQQAGGQ